MSTINSDMLTLRHFIDCPTWAAAAGYEFNYLDCMAYTADLYGLAFSVLRCAASNFLGTEVHELPFVLMNIVGAICAVIFWPLIFWLVAIPVWLKCKSMRRRYQFGEAMTEIARGNLEQWQRECARKWRRTNP
ncbi:hypothetical protein UXO05_02785 [Enterobacter ludwigii]|uniref:hypothetical protein n=1 Tax=Enterobacter ludwigii TaxID=299767 RepID=UPI002FD1364C